MADKVLLIADAQRKGFAVVPNEDETGWLIVVPARPRNPLHMQGEFRTPERAWMTACLIARDWPA
jgi:hypothetical protein